MKAGAGNVFIGRARELAELERAMGDARAGNGAAVLVAGDAGIGKSRLVSLLAERASDADIAVLVGHCLDLAGTELAYHPFVEALRPWGEPWAPMGETGSGSQLRVFEAVRSLLGDHAETGAVLLVLEDVHWADVSTLDLIAYLAHNVDDLPVLLVMTARIDEVGSRGRMNTLADGIRRSGVGSVLHLAPLDTRDIEALLDAAATEPLPTTVAEAIVARCEGNPFFAEELLTVAGGSDEDLPRSLRDLLLHRTIGLGRTTLDLLRVAAAAGREAAYPVLCAAAGHPEAVVRDSVRRAVESGILVVHGDHVRFRHALLAEAVYTTVLPGEREEIHGRLAAYLAKAPGTSPAELARHWAAAGHPADALPAWVEAARRAERMSGLAEAHSHLERTLALWDRVPGADEIAGLELAEVCTWGARLASHVGAATRAVELTRRAIALTPADPPNQLALLHIRLGQYLRETGQDPAALAAVERAVALVPERPASHERAFALSALAGELVTLWRFSEALPLAREALGQARAVGAHEAEVRALMALGTAMVHRGGGGRGIACEETALEVAMSTGDLLGLERAYVNLTDLLTIVGRHRAAAALAAVGTEELHRLGVLSAVLTANHVEALFALGEWDECDRVSSAALRAATTSFPYMIPLLRADLDTGRGDFEAAHQHLDAALETMRADHGFGIYEATVAELALWERRWTDAHRLLEAARFLAASRETALLRVWFCAKALRSQAELAALARDCQDAHDALVWTEQARDVLADARLAAETAARVTPNATGWLALAEAEHTRVIGASEPAAWSAAGAVWDRLERPPLTAYCRWREAEAILGTGASRADAAPPLHAAYARAVGLGALPLVRELEALALRGRVALATPEEPHRTDPGLAGRLGLTPREAEILAHLTLGQTNREIARSLVISEKTTGIHVTHILHKLGVQNRLEAAGIAHRFAHPSSRTIPPPAGP